MFNTLNHFALSHLFILIIYVPLSIFLFRQTQNSIARIYSLHLISVSIWGFFGLIFCTTTNIIFAEFSWKMATLGVILIPVFFLHAVLLLINRESKKIIYLAYFQATFFIILLFNDKIYINYRYLFDQFYYPEGSFAYIMLFIIWTVIVLYANIELLFFYKKSYPKQRKQTIALILSLFSFGGGMNNFLPGFGLDIYPYGNYLILLHPFFIFYAILRHNLLNIHISITKSFVYSLLISFITLLYLTIVVSLENLLKHKFNYESFFITMVFAFIIGIFFVPLKNRIQKIIERIFYKQSHIETIYENEKLKQEIISSEKLKAISTLASGMAHEIKNPLTAIKTFTEYLPDKKNDPEFLENFSRIVSKEVDRIDELVHQLLDFAKPSPLSRKPTDINQLLNDTLNFLSSRLVKNNISVKREFATSNTTLNIDPNQFRQALLNIFLNAIDAMPNGGTMTIKTQSNDDTFTISILDTGPGIPPKDLPHIFDPFFSKKDGGTGLGLSITQGIIKEHNGKIDVQTKFNAGTRFIIQLSLIKK